MGRTYRSSGTFRPSRPQNKHHTGVRLLAWGENPPTRTCKRGRGMNNLYVWLNRRADGLTRRYCNAYKPVSTKRSPNRSLTPAGRTSSFSHLQARVDERRCVFRVVVVRESGCWRRKIFRRLAKNPNPSTFAPVLRNKAHVPRWGRRSKSGTVCVNKPKKMVRKGIKSIINHLQTFF